VVSFIKGFLEEILEKILENPRAKKKDDPDEALETDVGRWTAALGSPSSYSPRSTLGSAAASKPDASKWTNMEPRTVNLIEAAPERGQPLLLAKAGAAGAPREARAKGCWMSIGIFARVLKTARLDGLQGPL
jgi:hypothetical protein